MTIFCKNYRAMSEHKTCKVEVAYDTFKGLPFDRRPCFCRSGEAPPGGCDKAVFPTVEELVEREEKINQRIASVSKARAAIVAHLGGPWKRDTPGASGWIDCPVCGRQDGLEFGRAGYNGHIHAQCITPGCVSWIE